MSARTSRGGTTQPGAAAGAAGGPRQNEYFVPRDGIDREVITADICRYLGNDALVRPGHYENPQTGQIVQGYYITAYRNLTSAMIEDLKADSARWEQERRQQSARNTPGVQYRYSETHSARQQYGPTDSGYSDPVARDSYENPRFTGSGTVPGYSATPSTYTQSQSPYGQSGGYSSGQYPQGASTQSYSPQPDPRDPRYNPVTQGYVTDPPYVTTGANSQPGYDMYPRVQANPRPATSMVGQQAPSYVTSGQQQQPQYGTTAGAYYPTPTGYAPTPIQSQDPLYGRAPSTTGHSGYSPAQAQQQYEETPTPRTTAPSSSTQMASSGTSTTHSRRTGQETTERHSDRRHHDRQSRRN